jgi:hypothetical protein
LKEDGILMYKGKVYVLNSSELKDTTIKEMQNESYVGHSRYHKIISVVRNQYFGLRMKKEVANYIAGCLECQKVMTEHRTPTGLL